MNLQVLFLCLWLVKNSLKTRFSLIIKRGKMKNFHKTLLFTILLSLVVIVISIITQLSGESRIIGRCSYLDPVIIDILAFSAALFLVAEGFCRIFEHKSASLKRQFTRMIRIAFGFAILILHIMQFLHK